VEAERKLLIEVMYKADYCLPCLFMDQTVHEILPQYSDRVTYRRVEFMKESGRERFLDLSRSLYGDDAVMKHCRVAPVPSLFIEGEMVFDAIPPLFELEAAVREALEQFNPCSANDETHEQIHLEVLHEGPHCIPCEYMAKVVEEIATEFDSSLRWEKVLLTRREGAVRFDELARRLGRLPPVPAIFINSELAFDSIPGPEKLREHIGSLLHKAKNHHA